MELAILLVLLTLVLWFWALIDLAKTPKKYYKLKSLWLLIVLFFPMIGSVLYFQFKKIGYERGPRKFQPKFN